MPSVGRKAGGHCDPLTGCLQPIWLDNGRQKALSFVWLQSDYKLPPTTYREATKDRSHLAVDWAYFMDIFLGMTESFDAG